EQEITLWDGSLDKLHIGFRDDNDNATQEPYMIWGYGKPDGTSKMVMEKGSNHFFMRYGSQYGDVGLNLNHSGSISLISEATMNLHSRYPIEADNSIAAPEFNKTSTAVIKDNIRKYEGDALGIVMD